MQELLELQTGQVAFISGLMSGFSLSIAAQILRYGIRSFRAQAIFVMFVLTSLLFLLALYVDVRLSIELAGAETLSVEVLQKISQVRQLGTTGATIALVIFIVAIGSLGWLATTATGIITTGITVVMFLGFWFVWTQINTISTLL